ncbi:bacteriocin immunity protein [Enterococcus saccharolyticus]|uniref:bacteriocin immunity protein n=1 Tax=Enterococcus saccharolyticus TaxID=41997 RepID=UPI0039DF4681
MTAQTIVHALYNDLAQDSRTDVEAIKEVLLKVYPKLAKKDDPRLVSRLTNFIYFTAFNEKLTFSPSQQELLAQLNVISQKAGINNPYRTAIGSKEQF